MTMNGNGQANRAPGSSGARIFIGAYAINAACARSSYLVLKV